jgi:ABC-type sulfate/molybdate transport systems ATPase subunit
MHQLLDLIHLENLAQCYPAQLSGGQRQRVALVRALAVEPWVLLLDEPFGALDATVRRELRRWLRRQLHDEIPVTSIFVTHDQEEALAVADRVAVMNGGRIEQFAPPQDVYERPQTGFAYRFLGHYKHTLASGIRRCQRWPGRSARQRSRAGGARASSGIAGLLSGVGVGCSWIELPVDVEHHPLAGNLIDYRQALD